MTHLQRQSSPFGSYDPHYSGRLQNLQKGRLSKKCGLGVRHRKLHQAQHREEHQSSTCVSKADGPTFYTRAKRRCLLRGRKYQNSVLKQSTILLTCDKVTLLCGRSWRFTLNWDTPHGRDVVTQGGEPGALGAETSFFTCQGFSSHSGEVSSCLFGISF